MLSLRNGIKRSYEIVPKRKNTHNGQGLVNQVFAVSTSVYLVVEPAKNLIRFFLSCVRTFELGPQVRFVRSDSR